jgi:hypothetical protein
VFAHPHTVCAVCEIVQIGSKYFDRNSFTCKFVKTKKPIYLNINILSLMSKHESLKSFAINLLSKQVPVDVIALQEIWSIIYIELVHIPGFQPLTYSSRAGMRGGGVGFYMRDGLHFEKINNLSTFVEKTFECLSVEVQYD